MSEENTVVSLGIADRISLLSIMPAEGNVITMRVMRGFTSDLSFTSKELEEWCIVTEGQQIRWDSNEDTDREYAIAPAVMGIIKSTLKKLDDEQKITAALLPVYEKFME